MIDIDAIRARADAATPGTWKTGNRFMSGSLGSSVVVLSGDLPAIELDPYRNGRANAAFIAHAREDIPALLDEVERLRAKLAEDSDELRDKRTDLLNIRGVLSPNGGQVVTPIDLSESVAPAVQWLVNEVERLRVEHGGAE